MASDLKGDSTAAELLAEAGADRRALGKALRAEREPTAAQVREERDPDTPALLGELSHAERRLRELEQEAQANGWAVDRKAMIYVHVLPPGHVHTRLTEDMRVYDAGCDGCTRYHRLNRDGRMIAPEITREEAAAVLGARERPSGEGTA